MRSCTVNFVLCFCSFHCCRALSFTFLLIQVHLVIVGSVVEEEYQPLADRFANAHLLPREDDATAESTSSGNEQLDGATVAQLLQLSTSTLPPLAHYTGVSWLDSVSATTLLQSLRCASASVNSSRSEGQSGAILESMHLRVPVVARRIRGNESLVQHCRNGMMFDSPEVSERALADSPARGPGIRFARSWRNSHDNSCGLCAALGFVPACL